MSENEKRDRYLRMNTKDREAIKKVKEERFDGECPLGYAARFACQKLLEDETDDDSGGVKF